MATNEQTQSRPSDSVLPPGLLDERVRELVAEAAERLAPIDRWVRTTARDRPLVALAAAVTAGYLVGRLFRRA